MSESANLLAEYAAGSEAAFREIVSRYIDFVYSAALRLVAGDAHLAEDIAQTVFLDLARAASSLSTDVRLGGWLHRHTCFVAAKTMRSNRRREIREREAVQMSALENQTNLSEASQILDEAINQLGVTDRAAILLRFFEGLDFRAVGAALGSSEAAAQRRVSRALEKLSRLLAKRGVQFTAAGLAGALSAQAVSAAPIGMAASVASSVLLAAPQSASVFSLIKFMALSKTKTAAVLAIIAAAIVSPLIFNRDSSANMAALQKRLGEQTTQFAALTEENEQLANGLESVTQSLARGRIESGKLEAEAANLKSQAGETKALREEIRQTGLRRLGSDLTVWQGRELGVERRKLTTAWSTAFLDYARAHHGQLPASFEEAEPFWPKNAAKGKIPASQDFEILYHGSINDLANLRTNLDFMIFRERKLQPYVHLYDGKHYDKMGRFVVLANGDTPWGSVPAGQLDSEFTTWEQEFLPPNDAP